MIYNLIEKILFDLNNSFSKVRITVEDKDIKVYITTNYNSKFFDKVRKV